MTEQEWLASEDPHAMLDFLDAFVDPGTVVLPVRLQYRPPVTDRKLRLFACGVTRRQCPAAAAVLNATADAEAWADTGICRSTDYDMNASVAGDAARYAAETEWGEANARRRVSQEEKANLLRDIVGNPFRPVTLPYTCPHCRGGIMAATCVMCGNQPHLHPFRRVSAIVALAQAAYEERQPDGALDPVRLAILADALEEAGCPVEVKCGECPVLEKAKVNAQGYYDRDMAQVVIAWGKAKKACRCGGAGKVPHPLLAHLRSPGPHVRGCWAIDLLLGKE